jgi:hypothetical protein
MMIKTTATFFIGLAATELLIIGLVSGSQSDGQAVPFKNQC